MKTKITPHPPYRAPSPTRGEGNSSPQSSLHTSKTSAAITTLSGREGKISPQLSTIFEKIEKYFGDALQVLSVNQAWAFIDHATSPHDLRVYVQNNSLEQALTEASKHMVIFLVNALDVSLEYCKKYFSYCEIVTDHLKNTMIFCSNHYWYAGGYLEKFQAWTNISHPLAQNAFGSRRYFFSDCFILKQYDLSHHAAAPSNTQELTQEVRFLQTFTQQYQKFPALMSHALNAQQGWLMREKLAGKPLSEVIEQESYCVDKITTSLLKQLALFETHNLFHTDLRLWNVIIAPEGDAVLIDYGSIHNNLRKVKNLYLNFMILFYELVTKTNIVCRKFRPSYLMQQNYHKKYYQWLMNILAIPPEHWHFTTFMEAFAQNEGNLLNFSVEKFNIWLKSTEKLITKNHLRLRHFEPILLKKLRCFAKKKSVLKYVDYYYTYALFRVYDFITLKFKKLRSC
ncbi:MAG: AarF/UbiB family protein [Gammaproteobacteria bacterium]